jgi:hypothetical protein
VQFAEAQPPSFALHGPTGVVGVHALPRTGGAAGHDAGFGAGTGCAASAPRCSAVWDDGSIVSVVPPPHATTAKIGKRLVMKKERDVMVGLLPAPLAGTRNLDLRFSRNRPRVRYTAVMQRAWLARVLATALAATLAPADDARAQPSAEGAELRVEYTVPVGCPDEAAFRRRLDARLHEAPPPRAGRAPRALAVHVVTSSRGYSGELRVRDADLAESSRTVEGATCDELVDALTFLSAVSMGVLTREPAPPVAPPPAATPPAPTPLQRDAAATRGEAPSRTTIAFGAGAVTSSFVGPGVGVGVEAFVEVGRDGPGLFAPALRLSGARAFGSSIDAGGGAASLTLTSARLEGCPVRFRASPTLAFSPCLGARVGALTGDASAIARAHAETELWLSADLIGRVQWTPLAPWLALEAQIGASVPLLRYEFQFLPSTILYQLPAIGWVSGVGLALRFP